MCQQEEEEEEDRLRTMWHEEEGRMCNKTRQEKRRDGSADSL
jgi:hypothetical protein